MFCDRPGWRGCGADADAPLRDVLAAALEANERLARLAEELRTENARLREEPARRNVQIEQTAAELAVLQRLREPGPGPGGRPRAGRRDYPRLPRVDATWDFEGGGYWCPACGVPFTLPGDHVAELLGRQVTVRVVAHCRRRYRRVCSCPVPATVTSPGPPKAIGNGLVPNGFIAMLLTGWYVAGRSQNSLAAGMARHAGIDEDTGQLAGDRPRRLVISSDFCSVYTSAGRRADGLVSLYRCAYAAAGLDRSSIAASR